MIRRHIVIASITLCGALALTGCTAGANSAPPENLTSETVSDGEACAAFGDVATITANADAGLRDGRMEAQEEQGWYRLATRVLDRVTSSGSGEVSDAIAVMKDAAPVIGTGVMTKAGIGSPEWDTGREKLLKACNDAGFDLVLEMYTGG